MNSFSFLIIFLYGFLFFVLIDAQSADYESNNETSNRIPTIQPTTIVTSSQPNNNNDDDDYNNDDSSSLINKIGDINILVVTDVHSWVAGHRRHEGYEAIIQQAEGENDNSNNSTMTTKNIILDIDYGHLLSFYQRLKILCNNNGRELYFVMNGDFVDGTGLGMSKNLNELISILQHMPFDIINAGNHDLEKNITITNGLTKPNGLINWFNNKYITSNTIYAKTAQTTTDDNDESKPLGGTRYHLLKNKYNNKNILVFGFLYNMNDASKLVQVEHVEDVVQQSWFIDVLTNNKYDYILCMSHMDINDPLNNIILNAIRTYTGDNGNVVKQVPVQFITGHTHYRNYVNIDEYTTSFEAGRYLDTIGFLSYTFDDDGDNEDDTTTTTSTSNSNSSTTTTTTSSSERFQHLFLDANVATLVNALGIKSSSSDYDNEDNNNNNNNNDDNILQTDDGKQLSEYIYNLQESLGLNEIIGCIPQKQLQSIPLSYQSAINETNSLWNFFSKTIVPKMLFDDNPSGKVLLSSRGGTFRYNLYPGTTTLDDIISLTPFNNTYYVIARNVPGEHIFKLHTLLNDNDNHNTTNAQLLIYDELQNLPPYILIGDITSSKGLYDLYADNYDMELIIETMKKIHDLPINPITTSKTQTSIWITYIKKYWPCLFIGGNNDNNSGGSGGGNDSGGGSNSESSSNSNNYGNNNGGSSGTSTSSNTSSSSSSSSYTNQISLNLTQISLIIVLILGIGFGSVHTYYYIKKQRDDRVAIFQSCVQDAENESNSDFDVTTTTTTTTNTSNINGNNINGTTTTTTTTNPTTSTNGDDDDPELQII